jgi:hypothetical protein
MNRRARHMNAATLLFALCVMALADLAAGQQEPTELAAGEQALKEGDYATALRKFLPLARQGSAVAQYNLGVMSANGQGVQQDDKEAVHWYLLAAEQGSADAQFRLGFAYACGNGVPKGYKEALHWYLLAAEQGNIDAMLIVGGMYEHLRDDLHDDSYDGLSIADKNIRIEKDAEEAARWFRLAAERGDERGQRELGFMYEHGWGVPQDYKEAVHWYLLAANQGDAEAFVFFEDMDRELIDAARDGNLTKVRVLLAGNADLVFTIDENARTPLHWAASLRDPRLSTPRAYVVSPTPEVAELLLANKAEINAQDDTGSTPLHVAAAFGRRDVAEVLLAHGALVNIRDKNGRTPLSVAVLLGHKNVAELLRQHGGLE